MNGMFLAIQSRPETPPLVEATVADLRALQSDYEAFLKECPFRKGDLVTPKAGYATKGVGEPHVVVETIPGRAPDFGAVPGSTAYGTRCDMRIAKFIGSERYVYWTESYVFEPWISPTPAVEDSARYPGSYDPTDVDDVKIAVLTHLNMGQATFKVILDAVDASAERISDALRELLYAGNIAVTKGNEEEDEEDFYWIVVDGEAA